MHEYVREGKSLERGDFVALDGVAGLRKRVLGVLHKQTLNGGLVCGFGGTNRLSV